VARCRHLRQLRRRVRTIRRRALAYRYFQGARALSQLLAVVADAHTRRPASSLSLAVSELERLVAARAVASRMNPRQTCRFRLVSSGSDLFACARGSASRAVSVPESSHVNKKTAKPGVGTPVRREPHLARKPGSRGIALARGDSSFECNDGVARITGLE
jgi:hypothetical protein